MTQIEKVTCTESVDVSCHHSVDTWKEVGYGRPVDDPALPAMLEKGWGRIINITPSLNTMQTRNYSQYGATKTALEAMTMIWAQDFAGTFDLTQQGAYVQIPFNVPVGTTGIRVRYCFDNPGNVGNTLDIGVYEPKGSDPVWGQAQRRGPIRQGQQLGRCDRELLRVPVEPWS